MSYCAVWRFPLTARLVSTLVSSVLSNKALFAVLLVFSMVVRGLVPTGYMVERSAESGKLMVHICGAVPGAEYATLNLATGKWEISAASDDESPRPDVSTHCDFSLNVAHAVFDDPASIPEHVFGLPLLAGRVFVERTYSFKIRPPLPARGPPALI